MSFSEWWADHVGGGKSVHDVAVDFVAMGVPRVEASVRTAIRVMFPAAAIDPSPYFERAVHAVLHMMQETAGPAEVEIANRETSRLDDTIRRVAELEIKVTAADTRGKIPEAFRANANEKEMRAVGDLARESHRVAQFAADTASRTGEQVSNMRADVIDLVARRKIGASISRIRSTMGEIRRALDAIECRDEVGPADVQDVHAVENKIRAALEFMTKKGSQE